MFIDLISRSTEIHRWHAKRGGGCGLKFRRSGLGTEKLQVRSPGPAGSKWMG